MYREHLMDHYKHPRHEGELEDSDAEHEEKNPSCGDRVRIQAKVGDGVIADAKFSGEGCAISMAGASILLEEIIGKRVDDVLSMSKDDMLDLIGVELTTMRVKCGLLAQHTLKKALYKHEGQQMKGEW